MRLMTKKNIMAKDNEIVIQRTFDQPRERVFEAFIDPETIVEWWGPNGFSITTESMDVKVGGEWVFTMHGSDGTDYPNKIIYTAIQSPEKLAYEHQGEEGVKIKNFILNSPLRTAKATRSLPYERYSKQQKNEIDKLKKSVQFKVECKLWVG